ncbi:MAG TPA: 2-oxoglutarate and iron-dependent oxygenase domain-containing protein [Gammaproteobacteria bacterium]|nr:2-oxoglutarate and iron-dependent oxygenase domain-containing protein [Gammaproteobacteria bacterium]
MWSALPEIDLAPFMAAPQSAAGRDLVARLREACHGPGFCYLVGHGVPAELDAAVMNVSREFFALPDAERHALAIARSPHFRGYTVLGDERTKGVSDWREQLDVGPEEPAAVVARGDPPWRRLRGPNQWPASLPAMQPTVLAWMRAMDRVGLAVLRALALGLGLPVEHFDDVVLPRGDPHLKIIRYPAQPRGAGTGQGVGMHHDSGLVSFVLQDDVGGLQVDIDGQLVDATPKRGTYVMNLGEMLQAATQGYLRATKHRVVSPPSGRERLSVAYFFHPRLESVFAPILLPTKLAAQARGGENVDPNDPIFATFGDNYLKIRLRSHRDVARAHYSDLKPA